MPHNPTFSDADTSPDPESPTIPQTPATPDSPSTPESPASLASNDYETCTEDKNEKTDTVVIDTMMANQKLSRKKSQERKENYANIALMIFMLMLCLLNFYFALTYTPTSGCEPGEGAVNVSVFCLVAGMLSLPMAIISYVMWKKGRNPETAPRKSQKKSEGDVSVGKVVFCFTFWNLVLAFLGMVMYFFQFDFGCKISAIAIFILIWSMTQVCSL